MPRVPNHQVNDDWDNDEDEIIDDSNHRPNRPNRQEREWEEQRREQWRKRYREE